MNEVDRLANEHPVIKQELEEIRIGVNGFAQASGKRLPNHILNNVLSTIAIQEEGDVLEPKASVNQNTTKEGVERKLPVPVWAVAASVLLLVSLGFNIFFYGQLEESREEILALTQERSLLTNQVETTGQQLDYAQLRIAHFLNEDNIHVRMDGEAISPESFANVFWNKNTNAVFISVDNLPSPPEGHQYQLWAIKDGQAPIDAGIFDHNLLVQELKVIKGDVLAFAVTLEIEGGTQNATVDRTFVKGFLKNS